MKTRCFWEEAPRAEGFVDGEALGGVERWWSGGLSPHTTYDGWAWADGEKGGADRQAGVPIVLPKKNAVGPRGRTA